MRFSSSGDLNIMSNRYKIEINNERGRIIIKIISLEIVASDENFIVLT